MKKFFVLLLCVVMFMAIFAELQAYGAGSYGKEVNFKPTSSSKKYSSDAADELGIILYQSSNETITSFEVACTLQRLLNEVSQTEIEERSITKFKNYKEMANQKLVRQIYFVGALKVKNNRILVNTNCTRLEVARQFAYYDKYFKVYEQKKAVNLVDTKSAYAKYAYQAGLLDAPIRKFYPDTEITLEEFLDMLVRLQENSSVEIPLEAIQSSLVKSFKVTVDKENPVVGSSVKMNTNTQKYVDANVRNFDDIWTEDSRIAEVEAIDVTNLRICIKTHELDGKTRVFGSKNGKTEVLFELIVGTGIEYKKIELQSEVINVGDSVKMKYSYKGDEKLQWGSSDPSIVTVKDGVITGVSVGTCEITCWSKSYIGTAKVVVEKNNLKISTNEVVLKVGKTFPIDVTYVGEPGMNYVSTSTEYDVAYEVDGVIYAVGKGVATITFKVNDGSSTQNCKVIVK